MVPSLDVYGLLLLFKSNCSIGNLVSLIYSHLKLMQHKTIDSVLERGEKLDTLVEKSSDLSAASQVQCASKCFSHKSSIWRCMDEHTQTNSTTYWMVTQAHANSNIKNPTVCSCLQLVAFFLTILCVYPFKRSLKQGGFVLPHALLCGIISNLSNTCSTYVAFHFSVLIKFSYQEMI